MITAATGLGIQNTPPQLPPKTIVNEGGVKIEHYTRSGDHGPAHAHVIGGGPETKIGKSGKPLKGQPSLKAKQAKIVNRNKSLIRNSINKIRRYIKFFK